MASGGAAVAADGNESIQQRVARLAAQSHALEAELVTRIRELVETRAWEGAGFVSASHWLVVNAGYTEPEARRLVRAAGVVRELPEVMGMAAEGRVSSGTLAYVSGFVGEVADGHITEVLRICTPEQAKQSLREVRRVAPSTEEPVTRDPAAEAAPPVPREFHSGRFDDDGWYVYSGRLNPEHGAVVDAAFQRLTTPSGDGARPSAALAFVLMARTALGLELEGVVAPSPFTVVVTLPAAALLTGRGAGDIVGTGGRLELGSVLRLMSESPVRLLIEADGNPLYLGRAQRQPSVRQRLAATVRDGRRCRFPGCTRRRHLHLHHVIEWSRGGPTDIDHLVSLCWEHHHAVHEGGWRVEPDGAGRFEFHPPPNLRLLRPPGSLPAPVLPPGITADTPKPAGRGEPLTEYALNELVRFLLAG